MGADMSLIPGLAMSLVGAIVLLRGMRGRRIDDHPICRGCGFDLFGLPPESHRCSECGVDLQKPKTIRIGHRQPARVVMVLGMLVLFAGGAWLGTVWKPLFKQLDANQYKPVWWLLSDASSSTVPMRDAALKELLRRLQNKALNKAQVQRITQKALEVQADANKPWVTAWGDFVESAQVAKALPSEQWQRYVKQALTVFQLEARPKVRRGAPLPLRLKNDRARVGTTLRFYAGYQYQQMRISGIPSEHNRGGGGGSSLSSTGWGSSSWTVPLADPAFSKLANGPQTARLSVAMKVFTGPASGNVPTTGTPDYQAQLDLDAKWELVADATVKVVTDESQRPAMEKSLTVKAEHPTWAANEPDHVDVIVSCDKPPAGLAFDVLIRQGDKEWNLGSEAFKPGDNMSWHTGSKLPGLQGNVIDVILRPSVRAGESQVDCTEMWNGQIVFRDVQVAGMNPPATQPAR